ncbi:3-oxoacyl-ACP reductase FabG [Nocardiopsis terrae]
MSRSVLVTGGNRGIGLGIARGMAESGYKVAVTHRSGDAPEGLFGVRCDVTDTAQVEAAFTQVEAAQGPVDVLISNAGTTQDGLLARMTETSFCAVLDTNLTGTFRVARRAVGHMVENRFGRIVLLSSVVATSGAEGQSNYAASKSGMIGFARSLAREVGGHGITVNVVAPGFIETDMTSSLPERTRTKILAGVPADRPGQVEDVVSAVRFLADNRSGYITGAVLPVDGGAGMGH